jgi:hypothetical protein
MMEILFNEYCEDVLIPESDSSQLSDSERPKSPQIAAISYVLGEAMCETSPRYFLPLPPFTVNMGLNTDVQNTDVVLFVKSCITEEFLGYIYDQANLNVE